MQSEFILMALLAANDSCWLVGISSDTHSIIIGIHNKITQSEPAFSEIKMK